MRRHLLIAVAAGAGVLAVLQAPVALTASNAVPSSRLASQSQAITPNTLRPAACAGPTLTSIVTGDGNITSSPGNSLVLGGPADQKINGGPGNDCIIGGAGVDTINGGNGTDVCIGNVLTTFLNCETIVIW
jgi:Ca2+-binding RTX toxin-like protein